MLGLCGAPTGRRRRTTGREAIEAQVGLLGEALRVLAFATCTWKAWSIEDGGGHTR